MNDLRRLAEELRTLNADMTRCMRCGFCQAHCPVYGETLREFDVSRGKIALLAGTADELLRDAAAVAARLDRCLLCGSCQANCPSGTPALSIFIRARSIMTAYTGLSPVKKLVFRSLLPRPRLFDLALRIGSLFQGLVLRAVPGSAQGTVRAPLLSPLIGARHMHGLPRKPLHALYPDLNIPAANGKPTVLLYPGCMADRMYVSVGQACIKALRHHGAGVRMPSNLVCCGLPALASGDAAGFTLQVRRNIAILQQYSFEYITTPCGSCTAAMAEMWPEMGDFTGDERAYLRALAGKTLDINALLVDVFNARPAQPDPAAPIVTFHEPCHLRNSLKVTAQPRTLIRAAGHEIREMDECGRCCGCGGSFTLFHYDISRSIGQRKRDMIVDTGAPVAATACPACMMQLNDALSRNGDKVRVMHSVELYAASLPDEPAGSTE